MVSVGALVFDTVPTDGDMDVPPTDISMGLSEGEADGTRVSTPLRGFIDGSLDSIGSARLVGLGDATGIDEGQRESDDGVADRVWLASSRLGARVGT